MKLFDERLRIKSSIIPRESSSNVDSLIMLDDCNVGRVGVDGPGFRLC